jgi:hypothetical protein
MDAETEVSEKPLTRERAIERLVASEADIRAFGVRRLALFGSVARNQARGLIVMSTSWPSFCRAQNHTTGFWLCVSCSKHASVARWSW